MEKTILINGKPTTFYLSSNDSDGANNYKAVKYALTTAALAATKAPSGAVSLTIPTGTFPIGVPWTSPEAIDSARRASRDI